jgi:prepilin-type processing-associated H-X9-DG protein/prepilin-type N-terminal cleavage/methylation domain-containing protein
MLKYNKQSPVIRNAFTIIELLLVITIIVILFSMLMPSLRKAKEKAKEISCVGNLKQLAMAIDLYSADFNGYMPLVKNYSSSENAWIKGHHWINSVYPYINNNTAWNGKTDLEGIFICPSGKNEIYTTGIETKLTNYGYNNHIGKINNDGSWNTNYAPRKKNSFPSPSSFLVMTDIFYEYSTAFDFGNREAALNYLSLRHRTGVNFLFADSHVAYIKPLQKDDSFFHQSF